MEMTKSSSDTSKRTVSQGELTIGRKGHISHLTAWIGSNCDAVVSVLLVLAITLCALFDRRPIVRRYFSVDDSWAVDLYIKAHQGVWAGRDVVFTHGPLYQWLLGITSVFQGASLGSFFRFGHLGLFAYTVTVIFVSGRLLLRHHPSWKRAVLIVGFTIPWTYFEVREATGLVLFALMVYLFDSAVACNSIRLLPAALGSAAVISSFFVSGDSGIYGIIALLVVAGSYCICFRSARGAVRRVARFGLIMCAGLLAWAVLVAAWLGFHFWRDTWAIASTYRWAMAIPFTPPGSEWNLLLVLGTCCMAFGVAWHWREGKARSLAGQPVFLLAGAVFSLACLQSAIVRSDWLHLPIGWFAAIALAAFSLIAREAFVSRRFVVAQAMVAFGLLALYLNPGTFFLPTTLASALSPSNHNGSECPGSSRYLDGVCVPQSVNTRLAGVASYLQNHSGPSDSIVVFPFENIYGDLARRLIAGSVLQNYVAAGHWLLQRQLQSLEKKKPALAVYSVDSVHTTISEFPNFTRSPEIWLYLQGHYRTAAEIQPNLFVLHRDDARGKQWTAKYLPLEIDASAKHIIISGAGRVAIASRISWPAEADLIRIRLLLSYPPWWNLGKPWSVSVLIGRADGTTKRVPALVPPNREAEVWVYPGDDALLASYFSPESRAWRAGAGAPVTSLALDFSSMGWGSVRPRSGRIIRVEAVSLRLDGPPALNRRPNAHGLFPSM